MADMIQVVRENGTFQVDSFFDISYISNIGSSGLDGYTFTVDSFFDVEYRVSSIDTEMVSLSLSASPIFGDPDFDVRALDAVITAVAEAGGHVHYGHVTVLK
ncbi:MAG: hypothetical protein O2783_01080 [Chloroflexi bacterium]|nr:hypothetical protein [Chloroflexota bacterium]